MPRFLRTTKSQATLDPSDAVRLVARLMFNEHVPLSLNRLDLGLDEGDLLGVEAVLGVQLLVDLRDRLGPVDV